MKTLLLSSVLGLTLVATSASAAVNTEQTSIWKRSTAQTETAEKSTESNAQVWKRVRFAKVDVTKEEAPKKVWKRVRF